MNVYEAGLIKNKVIPSKINIDENLNKSISIDLGMVNLMTIYNPTGKQHLIKGGSLLSLNEFYVKKISELQNKNKTIYNKNNFNRLILLNDERIRKINVLFNQIINKITEVYDKKEIMIVGYNEHWKQNSNLYGDINRKFQQIPFKRLLNKLREKWEEKGKLFIEIEESYTSKCDALNLEEMINKKVYDGIRTKRGLFISKKGKAINSDLNGAINIMRKYYKEMKEIKGERIYNPERIDLRVKYNKK